MKEEFDHMDDLIGKYLAGEASQQERAQVEQMIALSDANASHFNHFRLIFERAKSVEGTQPFDADEAWIKVKSEIARSRGKTISFSPFGPLLKIAAIMIVAIGLGFFTYQWLSSPDEKMTLSSDNKILRDTLPDGSLAVLNKSSKLKYVYSPNSKRRKIELEGEAFFEVLHLEGKPFIIETGDVIIEDIGTTFNVKAFPDNPTIEVYVETGQVAFYTLKNSGLNLAAGETGVFDKRTQSFARILKTDTNKLAYKTGVFSFRNTDLATIVADLNSVYDTKIRLGNDALNNCRLNVAFRNEGIESIVEIIAETLKLTLTKEGEAFVLNGTSCGD